jgi:hypothetical protein
MRMKACRGEKAARVLVREVESQFEIVFSGRWHENTCHSL